MKKTMKSHLLSLWVAMSALFLLAAASPEMPEAKTSVRLQKEMSPSSPYIAAPELKAVILVSVGGPARGNNRDYYTWTVSASGGTAPYTYYWEYTIDGVHYNPFVTGTGTSQTAQMPLDFDLHLRVTATDANGVQDVGRKTTINTGDTTHP
jgi:hypothetical protein